MAPDNCPHSAVIETPLCSFDVVLGDKCVFPLSIHAVHVGAKMKVVTSESSINNYEYQPEVTEMSKKVVKIYKYTLSLIHI